MTVLIIALPSALGFGGSSGSGSNSGFGSSCLSTPRYPATVVRTWYVEPTYFPTSCRTVGYDDSFFNVSFDFILVPTELGWGEIVHNSSRYYGAGYCGSGQFSFPFGRPVDRVVTLNPVRCNGPFTTGKLIMNYYDQYLAQLVTAYSTVQY
jgi:hypothetical protein